MNESNTNPIEPEDETELESSELDTVTGGVPAARDPQSGLPTGQ
jgi:hypothetical protein